METIKRIGFDYAGRDDKAEQQSLANVDGDGAVPPTIVTKAHLELKQKIGGITNLILEPSFKEKSQDEQASYLFTLISSVALESELTTKNMLLGIV